MTGTAETPAARPPAAGAPDETTRDAAAHDAAAHDAAMPPEEADTAPPTDAEMRAIHRRALEQGDEPLRRLVKAYLTLRRITADVVTLVETREGGAAVAGTPLLQRARRLADAPRR